MGLSPSVPCWAASIASPMRSCILSWTATGAQGEPNTHGGSSRRRAKEKEGWAGYRHFASFPFFPLAFNELGGVLTCCLCWGAKTPYHPAFFLSAALSDGPLSAHTCSPRSNKQEDPLVLSGLDSRPKAKGREFGAGCSHRPQDECKPHNHNHNPTTQPRPLSLQGVDFALPPSVWLESSSGLRFEIAPMSEGGKVIPGCRGRRHPHICASFEHRPRTSSRGHSEWPQFLTHGPQEEAAPAFYPSSASNLPERSPCMA